MQRARSLATGMQSRSCALSSKGLKVRPLSGRGRCGSSLIVSAKKKKDSVEAIENVLQWTQAVQTQVADLRSVLLEAQKKKETTKETSQGSGRPAVEGILKDLLDRQERFFKEERDYWLKEREEWKRQETALRNEIARLQGLLLTQPATEVQPSVLSEEPPIESEEAKEVLAMKLDVQESIRTAMSAVNTEDVLSEKFDKLLKLSTNGLSSVLSQTDPVMQDGPDTEPHTETAQEPVLETAKSPPSGPPPALSSGDDDIYWVSQLHEALSQKGYYCGDEDVEDFFFGEGTLSALLTFQACSGLKETGTTDEHTWTALLGKDLKPVVGDISTTEETESASKEKEVVKDFPVLSEMDGGRDVHCLQVMLEVAGYSCGKDDMTWWHYGDETIAAMKTFQACNGLPESGVADANTWEMLAGPQKTMSDVMKRVKAEDIYEEDLSKTDRVWLLGEQRWERKL